MTKDMQVKHQEGREITAHQQGTEDTPLRPVTVIATRRWVGGLQDQEEQGDNLRIGVRGVQGHHERGESVATADHSPGRGYPGGTAALNHHHPQQMEPQRTPPRLILTPWRGRVASTRATRDKCEYRCRPRHPCNVFASSRKLSYIIWANIYICLLSNFFLIRLASCVLPGPGAMLWSPMHSYIFLMPRYHFTNVTSILV